MVNTSGIFNDLMGYKDEVQIDPVFDDMIKMLYEAGNKWREEHGLEDNCEIEVTRGKDNELTVKVTPKEKDDE